MNANAAKTHCPQGHPYEGDNLYVNPTTGARTCRECHRFYALKSHYKRSGKAQPSKRAEIAPFYRFR